MDLKARYYRRMIHDCAAFWLISPSFLSVIFSGDWERVVFPPHSSPPLIVQYRTTHTYVYANGSGENGGGGTNYCDGVISGKRMSIILYISTHVFPSCHQQACLSLYVKSLSMHRQSKRKKKKEGLYIWPALPLTDCCCLYDGVLPLK